VNLQVFLDLSVTAYALFGPEVRRLNWVIGLNKAMHYIISSHCNFFSCVGLYHRGPYLVPLFTGPW